MWTKALVRSALVALVTMVFSKEGVDVVSARALIALAFEYDDDTVLVDLVPSAC